MRAHPVAVRRLTSMTIFACARERKYSTLGASSRNLPLKVSVTPFCQSAKSWLRVMKGLKNLGVDESVLWGDFFFVEALTKVMR